METIRFIIATTVQHRWKIYQIDVKLAFLNGFLEEEVYIEQPISYEVKGQKENVLKLNKALYWLKQTPRAWYSHIDSYFLKNVFVKCLYEYIIYIKIKESSDTFIVYLYVDDSIFTSSNPKIFRDFKQAMLKEFEMKNIVLMTYYLGLLITFIEIPIMLYLKTLKQILWYIKNTINLGLFYHYSNNFDLIG